MSQPIPGTGKHYKPCKCTAHGERAEIFGHALYDPDKETKRQRQRRIVKKEFYSMKIEAKR